MQPILARAGILDITAVSKSDLILSGETNPLAIRINSSNGFDAGVIAKYVVETLKAKKVAFLTQNDVYGNGFQTAVEAEFKKLNFSGEVMMTEKFAFKDTDFRVQLTNLKGANPDAIIVTNSSNSSGLPAMVEQYRQADMKSAFVGAVGIMLPTVFKVAGDANNGIVSADIYFLEPAAVQRHPGKHSPSSPPLRRPMASSPTRAQRLAPPRYRSGHAPSRRPNRWTARRWQKRSAARPSRARCSATRNSCRTDSCSRDTSSSRSSTARRRSWKRCRKDVGAAVVRRVLAGQGFAR